MAVSPDGKMVVVADRRDVITFIDAETGKVIEEMSNRQLAPKGIEVRDPCLPILSTRLLYD